MLSKLARTTAVITVMGGLAVLPLSGAQAQWGGSGDDRDRGGSGDDRDRGGYDGRDDRGGQAPYRAVSYINPDTGAATANPNVAPDSDCGDPDRHDVQMVSPVGSTSKNVHNDACLFGGNGFRIYGERGFDGKASFESSGVGTINACPDPDDGGSRLARNDGGQRCFQTGYQDKGAAGVMDATGDGEYHARLNSNVEGMQNVTFCYDPEDNGCADATTKSSITIQWVNYDPGLSDGRDGRDRGGWGGDDGRWRR